MHSGMAKSMIRWSHCAACSSSSWRDKSQPDCPVPVMWLPCLQERLQLDEKQVARVLQARRTVLGHLSAAQDQRRAAYNVSGTCGSWCCWYW